MVMSKGQENILLRRPPVARPVSSHEGLGELVADVSKGKTSMPPAASGIVLHISSFQESW